MKKGTVVAPLFVFCFGLWPVSGALGAPVSSSSFASQHHEGAAPEPAL